MSSPSRGDRIPPDFEDIPGDQVEQDEDEGEEIKDGLQTFVFSATLSKDLQRNLKTRFRLKGNRKHSKRDPIPASTLGMRTVLQCSSVNKLSLPARLPLILDDLLLRLDFRDPKPEIIDLSPVGGMVSTLHEGKIECLSCDKVRLVNSEHGFLPDILNYSAPYPQDVYLYYFLLRYPGKSLVFLSSIDGIRRLMPLVELLSINAFPLHSHLEQRQRLKNLDRCVMNNAYF